MVLAHTIGSGGGTGGTGGTGSTGSGGTTSVTSGGTFSSVPSAVTPPASTKQVWLQFNNPFMPIHNSGGDVFSLTLLRGGIDVTLAAVAMSLP